MADGWQIIYFMDEQSVEVVPEKWICVEHDKMYSYWPKSISSTRIKMAIKSKEEPKEDWHKYRIRLMTRKVYTNFSLASLKANKATYMDNISTQSEGESDTPKKRIVKRPSRYEDSSDRTDDTDDSDISAIPTPPKIVRRECAYRDKNKSNTLTETSSCSDGNRILSSNNNSEISAHSPTGTLTEINIHSDSNRIFSSSNSLASSAGASSHVYTNSVQHSEEYKYILKQLHILNGRIQEQTNLIMTLINKNNVEERTEMETAVVQFNEFPVKDEEALKIIEDKLKDSKVREMLISKFVTIGGDNVKELIRRIMPRLIDDKILQEYSWVGGKGKKKFSLLNISDVVKDVCKKTCTTKHETEKNIESYIATYLSKSVERFTRREKRRISNEGTSDV